MVNDCTSTGELPLSMRSGVITLICKDASRKSSLSFWHPISLLNVDYKIISKSLTNRLAKVLQFVIHEVQTCSVPGRSITDTLHLIRNVFDFVEGKSMRCGLVNFDQAKAFDRVSHEYLWKTLQVFGFGPDFVARVKMLYTNAFSQVLVNGFLSEPFSVTRSVRQGCGLSPLLYVLCVEPLAHRLRMCPQFRGLALPGRAGEVKVVQYADNTTCFIRDERSLASILQIFSDFQLVSGAKLNLTKCKGYWLNNSANNFVSHCGIPFNSRGIKCLGVFFSSDSAVMAEENWSSVYAKCKGTIQSLSSRDLTLRGKAVTLQSLVCSKLWYMARIVGIPPGWLTRFNSLFFRFVWSKEAECQDRVNRLTTVQPSHLGGLGIPSISSKIEAFNILHIRDLVCGVST